MLQKIFRFLTGSVYARAVLPFLFDHMAQTENKNCVQHADESEQSYLWPLFQDALGTLYLAAQKGKRKGPVSVILYNKNLPHD